MFNGKGLVFRNSVVSISFREISQGYMVTVYSQSKVVLTPVGLHSRVGNKLLGIRLANTFLYSSVVVMA